MALRTFFYKSLATAASSNNLATSQSASAGVPLTLNGAATNFLSTTTTAAAAIGTVKIPLTSVTGITVGQSITDTTAVTLVPGTKVQAVGSNFVNIWPPVGGVGVGSGDTIVFPGVGTIDAVTATNTAIGRRVVIAYTGTDTSFTIVGTDSTGNIVTDTAVGASGSAVSNIDFVTVLSITPVGGGLTGVTAGTNGTAASPWNTWNTLVKPPLNIGMAVEVVSGTISYTVQHTYDDPNMLDTGLTYATPFSDPVLVNQTATADGLFVGGAIATRVFINSGTGVIRCRFNQIGVG